MDAIRRDRGQVTRIAKQKPMVCRYLGYCIRYHRSEFGFAGNLRKVSLRINEWADLTQNQTGGFDNIHRGWRFQRQLQPLVLPQLRHL